jgi:D-inositol-3-phosphate glycosyltransferase
MFMKIALVLDHANSRPIPGHADDSIPARELTREFTAEGHQVTVFSRGDDAQPSSSLAVTATKPLGDIAAFTVPLSSRWRSDPPDIVHAMRWTSGLVALAASRDLAIPVVQTFPSLGVAERRHGTALGAPWVERIRLEPAIGRTADAVLAANSGDASDLARLGVPRRHIKVIPCGVDTSRFAPEGPAAERGDRPRLVTVTELDQAHSLNTLLRALAKVPDAELVVAGGPPRAKLSGDDSYRGLCQLTRTLGVSDRVQFIGQVDEDELAPLLRSADLYVNTAEYEPTGMISLDAMACGTPVVTSAAGAPADAVVDGTTGIFVPSGRPSLLAHRIRHLLAHPMLLQAYSVAAADRATSRYSWDRIARETLAVYEAARHTQATSNLTPCASGSSSE